MKCYDCDGTGWIHRPNLVAWHNDFFEEHDEFSTSEIVGYEHDTQRLLGRVNDLEMGVLCPSCDGFGVEQEIKNYQQKKGYSYQTYWS